MMIGLAKEAKYSLLRDYLKKKLDAKMGKQLEKKADIIADAFIALMKEKGDMKKVVEEMEEKLEALWKEGK